jgi:hypothetical protein
MKVEHTPKENEMNTQANNGQNKRDFAEMEWMEKHEPAANWQPFWEWKKNAGFTFSHK